MTPSNMSGALPMTTASMSAPVHPGVLEGADGRLADEPGDGDVLALGRVLGLADTDHRGALGHLTPSRRPAGSAARAQTRFCCRHGPEVAWARAVRADPVHDPAGRLPDADEAGHHDAVGGQRTARRVHRSPKGRDRARRAGSAPGGRRARAVRPRRPPRSARRFRGRPPTAAERVEATPSGRALRERGSRSGGRCP